MARIIRPSAFGDPDVLRVVDVAVPDPTPGHVVVRVKAAGVNPIDWKLYSGAFHEIEDDHAEAAGVADDALPQLGLECSGVVTALGDGVGEADAQVSDEVIVYPATGAYADYVVAPTGSLIAKPATVSWAEAAALMLAGTTAAHALYAAGVGPGDTVLIHNGSGGVGLMAIQLAVGRGAAVIATTSRPNFEIVRSLGATPVAYGPGLLDRVRAGVGPDEVTAALDLIGTDEALDTSLTLVADPSRIASVNGGPRRAEEGLRVLGYGPGEDAGTEFRAAARADLAAKAGAGELRVVIDAEFPLEQAARAHRAGIAGHAPGKLVLVP